MSKGETLGEIVMLSLVCILKKMNGHCFLLLFFFCLFVCLVYVSHGKVNLMNPFEVCSVFFLLPRIL